MNSCSRALSSRRAGRRRSTPFAHCARRSRSGAADYAQITISDLGGINNTIQAVLYARKKGMGCCLGGTGNETDQSAPITAQIGLACPDLSP